MLDGPPDEKLAEEERARIAAVVGCLCERDGYPVPEWVYGVKARKRGGVMLVVDEHYRNRFGMAGGFYRIVRRETPKLACRHRGLV